MTQSEVDAALTIGYSQNMTTKRTTTLTALAALIAAPLIGTVTAEAAAAAPPAAVRYGTPCKPGHTEKGWNNTIKYVPNGDYLNRCVYKKETYGFKGLISSVPYTVWKIEDNYGSYMQKRC